MTTVLIGLDDTDNATSPGTGRLARDLLAQCACRGLGPRSVTRHQFLLDERIPYTSHNSGACVAVDCACVADAAFAAEFVARRAAEGSDPGVCIAARQAVPPEVTAFGWLATREVVEIAEAFRLAGAAGIELRALGGTGQGVIGALGSVGLRAEGNEGRFIDMPGLRELGECVPLSELAALGIEVVVQGAGPSADARQTCRTLGWVRPRLLCGRAVLPVQWSQDQHAWIPVDRKQSRPLE